MTSVYREEELLCQTDGRHYLTIEGSRFKVQRKWLRMTGVDLGPNGSLEFTWTDSSSEFYPVRIRKLPEGASFEVQIETKVGVRTATRCSATWTTGGVDTAMVVAALAFFWTMDERDRTFNA